MSVASKIEQRGSLFDELSNQTSNNFKVVLRVRPLNESEISRGEETCVKFVSPTVLTLSKPSNAKRSVSDSWKSTTLSTQHTFTYDRIFQPHDDQETLFDTTVRPAVISTLEGYNSSVIAYGQTGTGKTFTIEGEEGPKRGIISRAGEVIFDHIKDNSIQHSTQSPTPTNDTSKKHGKSKYLVRISFLQIYNDVISDLLANEPKDVKDLTRVISPTNANAKDQQCTIREDGGVVSVVGLSEHVVKTPEEIQKLMFRGKRCRESAATIYNQSSSRSHAVFSIIVEHSSEIRQGGVPVVTIAKLNMVDLAGSERLNKSGSKNDSVKSTSNERIGETKNINSSLSVFGKVILALTTPATTHVPYRECKLTRILQNSLGGNCKTVLISTANASSTSYQETLTSLKFAYRAKDVKNTAKINQDKDDQALVTAYQREILKLRNELDAITQRSDIVAATDQLATNKHQLETLQHEHSELANENQRNNVELEKRAKEIEMHDEEMAQLLDRVQFLEEQLLSGSDFDRMSSRGELARQSTVTFNSKPDDVFRFDNDDTNTNADGEYPDSHHHHHTNNSSINSNGYNHYDNNNHNNNHNRNTNNTNTNNANANGTVQQMASERWKRHRFLPPHLHSTPHTSQFDSSRTSNNFQNKNEWSSEEHDESNWLDEHHGQQLDVLDSPEVVDIQSELSHPKTGILPREMDIDGVHASVFSGSDAVIWFLGNVEGVEDVDAAEHLGQHLLNARDIFRIDGDAMFNGSEHILYSLVQPKTESGCAFENTFPLHAAAANGDHQNIKDYLAIMDIDGGDNNALTPLMHACIRNQKRVVDGFLRAGCNVQLQDNNKRSALVWAAYAGHHKCLASVLNADKSMLGVPDAEGRTALHWSTKHAKPSCLMTLLNVAPPVIINMQDVSGATALHWSVLYKQPQNSALLLKWGASTILKDKDGRTPAHYAVVDSLVECLKYLLLHDGTTVANIKDNNGRTLLHLATTAKCSIECGALILACGGVDVDATDDSGASPLHWAAVNNNSTFCSLLVQHGANISHIDNDGKSAMDHASNQGYLDCAIALQQLQDNPMSATVGELPLNTTTTTTSPLARRLSFRRSSRSAHTATSSSSPASLTNTAHSTSRGGRGHNTLRNTSAPPPGVSHRPTSVEGDGKMSKLCVIS